MCWIEEDSRSFSQAVNPKSGIYSTNPTAKKLSNVKVPLKIYVDLGLTFGF